MTDLPFWTGDEAWRRTLAALMFGAPITEETDEAGWARIAAISEAHRLGPWLHFQVSKSRAAHVPTTLVEAWSADAHEAMARTLFQQNAVQALHTELTEFAPVFLKGAALFFHAYDQPWHRPLRDIDILIANPQHAVAAWKRLLQQGYRTALDHVGDPVAIIAERHQLPVLVTPDGTTFVEIHQRIFHSEGFEGNLVAETRSIDTLGMPVRFLGPEAQLIHLVGHAARDHLFDNGPQVLVDIAMLKRAHDFDDVLLKRLATSADLRSETELLLKMSQDVFESDVRQPTSFEQAAGLAWDLMTTPPHNVSAARDRLSMRSDAGKWRRRMLPTQAMLAMSQGPAGGPFNVIMQYGRHYARLLTSRLPRLLGRGGHHDIEQKLRSFSAKMRG